MKKICLYVMTLVILTFIIPVVFTRSGIRNVSASNDGNLQQGEDKELNSNNEKNIAKYDYKDYSTIKLFHSKTNTIEEIGLDEYLYGVVSAEMPADFNIEALKAQAIVARTYTIYKIIENDSKHGDAHICDDSKCCQAWITKEDRLARWEEDKREENWNKIVMAVTDTKGRVITYEGKPINAFFHSNSGGATEAPSDVWGGSNYPYLQTVETSGEDAYIQYSSEVELSKADFIAKMKEKYSDFSINFDEENCIQVVEYTSGGRIKTIKIGNKNISGVEARNIFGLKSANFIIDIAENIKFEVTGYGHGVGMSQTGADSLAKQGYVCDDIIKHFYTGVEVENW